MLWSASERPKVLAKHPELKSKVTEVAKLLGARWRALGEDEKADWKQRAAEAAEDQQ
jgi:hypothetical protein